MYLEKRIDEISEFWIQISYSKRKIFHMIITYSIFSKNYIRFMHHEM